MKQLFKTFLILSLLLFIQGSTLAQALNDQAAVLQLCLNLSELKAKYPLDAAGNPMPIHVIQYPVSFQPGMEVTANGSKVLFASLEDLDENKFHAYVRFRIFEINPNSAEVLINYFYKQEASSKRSEMLSLKVFLQKGTQGWSVQSTHLK